MSFDKLFRHWNRKVKSRSLSHGSLGRCSIIEGTAMNTRQLRVLARVILAGSVSKNSTVLSEGKIQSNARQC